jgi:hypothetical protein
MSEAKRIKALENRVHDLEFKVSILVAINNYSKRKRKIND